MQGQRDIHYTPLHVPQIMPDAIHVTAFHSMPSRQSHAATAPPATQAEELDSIHCGTCEVPSKDLDYLSGFISLGCFLTSLVYFFTQGDTADKPIVRISREIFLYTRKQPFYDQLRLAHRNYHDYCPDYLDFKLQRPDWQEFAEGEFDGGGHLVSVYAFPLNLWYVVLWIFAWSAIFQFGRALGFHKWYFPEKGPEFSRWLEYFFTAPFQILIVALSFGFSNLDTLLGAMGMQAGLVLLGYDIEQQIKKIYKRDLDAWARTEMNELTRTKKRFQHVLRNWHIPDLRIWVYLFVAWMLHTLIWGLPRLTEHLPFLYLPWGIGGKYQMQKFHNEKCEKDPDFAIPGFVDFIFWSQFFLFTSFGVVCTWQAASAMYLPSEKDQNRKWRNISIWYSFLSITAKTLLEAGFLMLVARFKQWKDIDPVSYACALDAPFNTCFNVSSA